MKRGTVSCIPACGTRTRTPPCHTMPRPTPRLRSFSCVHVLNTLPQFSLLPGALLPGALHSFGLHSQSPAGKRHPFDFNPPLSLFRLLTPSLTNSVLCSLRSPAPPASARSRVQAPHRAGHGHENGSLPQEDGRRLRRVRPCVCMWPRMWLWTMTMVAGCGWWVGGQTCGRTCTGCTLSKFHSMQEAGCMQQGAAAAAGSRAGGSTPS